MDLNPAGNDSARGHTRMVQVPIGVIQDREARLRELETWLALMVIRHGYRNQDGWRFEMTVQESSVLRALIAHHRDPTVIISLGDDGVFVLDML